MLSKIFVALLVALAGYSCSYVLGAIACLILKITLSFLSIFICMTVMVMSSLIALALSMVLGGKKR